MKVSRRECRVKLEVVTLALPSAKNPPLGCIVKSPTSVRLGRILDRFPSFHECVPRHLLEPARLLATHFGWRPQSLRAQPCQGRVQTATGEIGPLGGRVNAVLVKLPQSLLLRRIPKELHPRKHAWRDGHTESSSQPDVRCVKCDKPVGIRKRS